MRIYLSAFGWILDPPAGHRLRWHYPAAAVDDRGYLGLPDMVEVQRAPVDADFLGHPRDADAPPSTVTPVNWWDSLGHVDLGAAGQRIDLNGVQAVRFLYRGTSARAVAIDAASPVPAFDAVLRHDEQYTIEGASLAQLRVSSLSPYDVLRDVEVLDLFAERDLHWETVATIGVAASVDAPLADVQARHGSPRLNVSAWDQLRAIARDAVTSSPGAPGPGDLTHWDRFHAVLGMRWEHAVLFGAGWCDGESRDVSPLDQVHWPLGDLPSSEMAEAYRIVDPSGRLEWPSSNVAVVMNDVVPDLAEPRAVIVEDPEITVRPPHGPGSDPDDQRYVATWAVRWQGGDTGTIGVEVTEQISASPTQGGDALTIVYESRNRDRTGPPAAQVDRHVDHLAFVDVSLTATATAIDAWDRTSAHAAASPPVDFVLRHEPPPPPLASAWRDGDRVTLHQLVGGIGPDGDDRAGPRGLWTPDRLVKEAGGTVLVLRQVARPTTATVTVDHPVPVDRGGPHRVRIIDPPMFDATPFVRGWLAAGTIRVRIDRANPATPSGTDLYYRAPLDARQNPVMFGRGPAVLSQDAGTTELWQEIRSFPADDVPDPMVISDPVSAGTDKAVTRSYTTRVSFLGRVGPTGNTVSATWLPPTPLVPPPFTVTLLGRDFYDRTLVQVVLTTPSSGRFTLWWAEGSHAPTTFRGLATPGLLGEQDAPDGVLYDVLPLPVAKRVDRTITYGLQRVNGAGGQSIFSLRTDVLVAESS